MLARNILIGLSALTALGAAEDLPILNLPWGKWKAEALPNDPKIAVYRNVRFGAQPERFGAPSYPNWEDDSFQKPEHNVSCYQINPFKLKNPPEGPGSVLAPKEKLYQTEDCLFLDIYAPKDALEKGEKLPVVVWIYGGGYAFGSKTQGGSMYSGQSIITASNYNAIFITGNYRLGALGWLAGNYMEENGLPNAGLYDQALLFEWVQEYVDQVAGDKEKVTAWGESAGAGSILHHLIREGGQVNPTFRSFYAASPGHQWAWNNSANGTLDMIYQKFSALAGCGLEKNITCLRDKDIEVLAEADQKLYEEVRLTGLFPIGPSVDGKWIKEISPIAIAKGNIWKKIDTALITHVANEGLVFAPDYVTDEEGYDYFLNQFLPGPELKTQRTKIKEQYDCKNYPNEPKYSLCVAQIIAHAVFNCNGRDLFNTFSDRSYVMEYSFPFDGLTIHGTDLIPLFSNNLEEISEAIPDIPDIPDLPDWIKLIPPALRIGLEYKVRKKLQSYAASFAVHGDPNRLEDEERISWPLADGKSDQLKDVLQVRGLLDNPLVPWGLIQDTKNSNSSCQFWTDLAEDIIQSESANRGDGYIGSQSPLGSLEL
ncbi:unnamed protein product [Clonostachys rhizophaga]|uniref:Carboxylesterase type B domain-containing protein n=1 Tax=Clonostachys rhizophaga TaxID=160324 RepID=A0A9N9YUB2_9HYPO|nr:unnamed protein product [Clonostachys rhizophaga]